MLWSQVTKECETHMKCNQCNEDLIPQENTGGMVTCVAYYSPEGHDHDDNCKTRIYHCKNDHYVKLSIINTCPSCDWKGKTDCFCSIKIDKWPSTPASDP